MRTARPISAVRSFARRTVLRAANRRWRKPSSVWAPRGTSTSSLRPQLDRQERDAARSGCALPRALRQRSLERHADDLRRRQGPALHALDPILDRLCARDEPWGHPVRRSARLPGRAMADVFGTLVEQWKNNQTAEGTDWLVGREILAPGVTGRALRSLEAPGTAYDDDVLGKDPRPAHMDDFVVTDDDHGGVQINSGIPNRAFVLVSKRLGGNALQDAWRIWYASLGHERLLPTST